MVTFCHQSYSDFWIATRLADDITNGAKTVFEAIGNREAQSLFRREQVRLLLSLMRDDNPSLYIDTLRSLLTSDGIRFHLKQLCLQFLGQVDSPLDEEVELALELAAEPKWREHVIDQVFWRHSGWICDHRMKDKLCDWLRGDDEEFVEHALRLLRSITSECGDVVAEFIEPFEQDTGGKWPARIDWMLAQSPQQDSTRLFALRLRRAATNRTFDYVDWKKLADATPDRSLPLLAARLKALLFELQDANDDEAWANPADHWASILGVNNVAEMEALRQRAVDDPTYVWDEVVPIVEQILEFRRTHIYGESQGPMRDVPHRRWTSHVLRFLHDLLVDSGKVLVRSNFQAFAPLLSKLFKHSVSIC